MARLRRLTVALACALLVLGASRCGGSDDAQEMTVVGTEMAFEAPSSTPAGDYVVTFRNEGTIGHEVAFRDPTGAIAARRSIGAGQSAQLEVELTPGQWELGCFEPGHYDGGMHSPLEVIG